MKDVEIIENADNVNSEVSRTSLSYDMDNDFSNTHPNHDEVVH